MGIGTNLQRVLNDRGISKIQLAEISGVSYSSITKIIKEDKYGRKSTVEKISKCLGISVEKLTSDELTDTSSSISDEDMNTIILNQDLKNKKIFLIDFENEMVEEPNFDFLYVNNSISYCFFNSNIYSTKYFDLFKHTGIKTSIVPIYTTKVRDQYIDHLILFYIGAITTKFNDSEIYVISGDKGFQAPIDYIKNNFKLKTEFLLLKKHVNLSNYINKDTGEINLITNNEPIVKQESEKEVACTSDNTKVTRVPYKDRLHRTSLAFCSHIKKSSLFTVGVSYNKSVIFKHINEFIDGKASVAAISLFKHMTDHDIFIKTTEKDCFLINHKKIDRLIAD